MTEKAKVFNQVEAIVDHLVKAAKSGDQFLVMSNGGFGGIHEKLLAALEAKL
jgi:UDP-N-acetylmuramate: L-alanyl-gamma-D-glutamyl-meso-diaminopimelate ligase